MRETTNVLIDMVDDGILSWEQIARAALNYMSEDDVKDMAECNEFIDSSEDDNDLDEDNW